MVFSLLQFCLGLILGKVFPDVDLAPLPVWRHRSWLTHGVLLPLGVWELATMFIDYKIFFFAFLAALTIHLLEDAGPKSWRGSAMVNFYPLPFSLPPFFSMLYIFGAAMFSAWASLSLM